jgi:hypothetical protein
MSIHEFPVKNTDSLLIYNSNQQLVSYIKLYDTKYTGPVTPTSKYSCQMIAASLKDRLIKNPFVENDYFSIIAFEESQGRTLIAFDKSWILPAVIKYIENDLTYEMENTVALREEIAAYSKPTEWDQIPFLKGQKLKLSDLIIYPIQDSAFTNSEGGKSQAYMIFAPANEDEAEKIYLYLYRDTLLYTNTHYLTVKDEPIYKIKDFQYLFPVDVKNLGNYAMISTDQMTFDKLEHIYQFDEVYFEFPAVNDLNGAFATYLLAEKTYFQYSLRWERNILFIGLCGYIQALDIMENFGQVLTEIAKESPIYKELPNYATAVSLVEQSDCKCFYHNGTYYAALYSDIQINYKQGGEDVSRIELVNPLTAVDNKEYLRSLGYDINSEPYMYDLDLEYKTYNLHTLYYYKATNRDEVPVYETDGPYNEELKFKLEKLLRNGDLFTQRTKNILRGYPGFIPSDNILFNW